MTQDQRLNFLVQRFREDARDYQNIPTGETAEERRTILRSLMNIRMPGMLDQETLDIQDAYLLERNAEKGIVSPSEIETVAASLGSSHPFAPVLSIWQGDITRLAADAIVNAANSQMLGCFVPMHTCIDNCIHTYAGVQLRAECHRQMRDLRRKYGADYEQPTAVPMLTGGYNLPAKHVIHVVGPIVQGSLSPALEADLASCYRNVLDLCREHELRTVAFCCISTGVFRFPNDRATEIAVETVTRWLEQNNGQIDRVIFNVFKEEDLALYGKLLCGR